jgi:hypothetical protein
MADIRNPLQVDRLSFQLGMINCFAEMVACGVKKLAISPPLSPEEYEQLREASEQIVERSGVKSYLERSLMVSGLQTEGFTRGKWSVLYYKEDETLEAYLRLKERMRRIEGSGEQDREAAEEISREFMRLLSYPDAVIEAKLSQESPGDPYIYLQSERES